MINVVGVRFHNAGKIYSFACADLALKQHDTIIVETNRGNELGVVATLPHEMPDPDTDQIKPVIRLATNEDVEQAKLQKEHAVQALAKCRELIPNLNLQMKAISAQFNLDGSHLIIYFYAEQRVDFRELVRKLSHELKTHVELRQVGARDEAKLIGGIGKCGCKICCTSFLTEFMPVSIKMAKEQDIALNPMKTSGLCGRLLCCLGYEYEQYRQLKDTLPEMGSEIITKMGKAKIVGRNVVKNTLTAQLETGVNIEVPLNEVVRTKK